MDLEGNVSCEEEVKLIREFGWKLEASKTSQVEDHKNKKESGETEGEEGLDLSIRRILKKPMMSIMKK